jgi:hypothetical protein
VQRLLRRGAAAPNRIPGQKRPARYHGRKYWRSKERGLPKSRSAWRRLFAASLRRPRRQHYLRSRGRQRRSRLCRASATRLPNAGRRRRLPSSTRSGSSSTATSVHRRNQASGSSAKRSKGRSTISSIARVRRKWHPAARRKRRMRSNMRATSIRGMKKAKLLPMRCNQQACGRRRLAPAAILITQRGKISVACSRTEPIGRRMKRRN